MWKEKQRKLVWKAIREKERESRSKREEGGERKQKNSPDARGICKFLPCTVSIADSITRPAVKAENIFSIAS